MNPNQIAKILDEIPVENAWRRPDSIVRESEGWFQIITPSSSLIPLNGIYRSLIEYQKVDEVISETIETYRQIGASFRWIITGASRPTDLGQFLIKWNFKKDHEAIGFAQPTSELMHQEMDPIIVVKDLVEEDLNEWVDASVSGWGNSESFRVSLLNDIPRALREQRNSLRYISAFVDGKLVGTGSLRFCKHSGHLNGSSVRPEFRGRGIYRAMVLRRAQIASEQNLPLISTHGIKNTSAPILTKMGFQKYSEAIQYSYSF